MESATMDITATKKYEVPWTIKDFLLVIACLILVSATIFSALVFHLLSKSTAHLVFLYSNDILIALLPIWLIKKKYGLPKEALGLRKGDLNFFKKTYAVLFAFICYIILVGPPPIKDIPTVHASNFVWILLSPFVLNGGTTVLLTPVCEEIGHRGFFYAYLRKRRGIILSLFIQALIISLVHINTADGHFSLRLFYCRFIFQSIAGLMFEVTGSLYPSMAFHMMVNYFSALTGYYAYR